MREIISFEKLLNDKGAIMVKAEIINGHIYCSYDLEKEEVEDTVRSLQTFLQNWNDTIDEEVVRLGKWN